MSTYAINLKSVEGQGSDKPSAAPSSLPSPSPLPVSPPPSTSPVEQVPPVPVPASLSSPSSGSGVSSYEDIVSLYMKPSMSTEEMERRKRAASAASAVAHLGNTLSSFSNLVFAGQGAPSQKLPTVQDPNLRTFEDRIRSEYLKYGDDLTKARRMDVADRAARDQAEFERRFRERQQQIADAQKKAELKYKQDRDKVNDGFRQQEFEEKKRHNQAVEKIQTSGVNVRAANQRSSDNKVLDSVMGSDGNIYTRNTKLSTSEMKQMFLDSGFDDLKKFEYDQKYDYLGKPIPDSGKIDYEAAFSAAVSGGYISAEELKSRGFKLGGRSDSKDVTPPGRRKPNDAVPPSRRKPNDAVPPSRRK